LHPDGARVRGTLTDMWVTVELTAPEGYTITSDSSQTILTGTDTGRSDFGIAPSPTRFVVKRFSAVLPPRKTPLKRSTTNG